VAATVALMLSLPVSLSVVMPCFDEERRLGASLQAVRDALALVDRSLDGWELVVVDDHSTDGTAGIAQAAAAADGRIRLVTTARGKGKGAAVRSGVLATSGASVLVVDADLAGDLASLPAMLQLLANADAVLGSRLLAGAVVEPPRSLGRRSAAMLFRGAVRLATPLRVSDPQCGHKLFRGDVLRRHAQRLQTDGYAYEIELLLRLRAEGATMVDVPITWREGRDSKVRVVADGAGMLRDLWNARRVARLP